MVRAFILLFPFIISSEYCAQFKSIFSRNLADVNRDGKLTREAFVVVIRLIKTRVSGRDLPGVLPPSLVPDSTRQPTSSVQGTSERRCMVSFRDTYVLTFALVNSSRGAPSRSLGSR